jgi:hypothetical protein
LPNSVEVEPAHSEVNAVSPATGPFGTPLGARVLDGNRCEFRVWAPKAESVELHIVAPQDRRVPLKKNESGYHEAIVDGVGEGAQALGEAVRGVGALAAGEDQLFHGVAAVNEGIAEVLHADLLGGEGGGSPG